MAQEKHEMEIVIDAQGRVTVEVKGVKGQGCLKYLEQFEETLGRVKSKRLTGEYYEPPRSGSIVDKEKTRTRRLDS
jgi:hypothetical protein